MTRCGYRNGMYGKLGIYVVHSYCNYQFFFFCNWSKHPGFVPIVTFSSFLLDYVRSLVSYSLSYQKPRIL